MKPTLQLVALIEYVSTRSMTTFETMFSDCCFHQLKRLDLSHSTVLNGYRLETVEYVLPLSLKTLILDDVSGFPPALFASKQSNLINLSMSYNRLRLEDLQNLFKSLPRLQSLYLRGKECPYVTCIRLTLWLLFNNG